MIEGEEIHLLFSHVDDAMMPRSSARVDVPSRRLALSHSRKRGGGGGGGPAGLATGHWCHLCASRSRTCDDMPWRSQTTCSLVAVAGEWAWLCNQIIRYKNMIAFLRFSFLILLFSLSLSLIT